MNWVQKYKNEIFYSIFFGTILFAIGVTYYTMYILGDYTQLQPTIFESEDVVSETL